jgi:DNA-binding transcriptional LysR family regulator
MVQSAVSAGIRALERDLGATLLERSSRPVRLTPAGLALLPQARNALDAVRAARDAVDEVTSGLRGSIGIGTMLSLGRIDLASVLGTFHRRHPGITMRVRVSPAGSRGLAAWLLEGELDVAFASFAGPPPAGLTARDLTSTPMVALVPAGHPLADRGRLRLADLAGEAFVDFPGGYATRDLTDRAFAALGVARRVAVEITGIESLSGFVRAGLGVTIMPASFVRPDPALRAIPFAGDPPTFTVCAVTPSDRRPSAAVRALLEIARGAAADASAGPAAGPAAEDGGHAPG